jgi:hypothetical protein
MSKDNKTLLGGAILIPVSPGELLDKISILEIKAMRLQGETKLTHVLNELELLQETKSAYGLTGSGLEDLSAELKATNEALWNIEDEIRDCERQSDFGERFITLARSVYRQNDRRAALKREINLLCDSALIEEKSYSSY